MPNKKYRKKTHNDSISNALKRVVPTNTLFFLPNGPRLCEKQTATVRNHTIDCMEDDDVGAVACRYLQNKYGAISGRNMLIMYTLAFSLLSLICLVVAPMLIRHAHSDKLSDNELDQVENECRLLFLLPMCILLVTNLHFIPHIANTLRLKETKEGCKSWLKQKLGENDFKFIDTLSYDQAGFFKVVGLIEKRGLKSISRENLPEHLQNLVGENKKVG